MRRDSRVELELTSESEGDAPEDRLLRAAAALGISSVRLQMLSELEQATFSVSELMERTQLSRNAVRANLAALRHLLSIESRDVPNRFRPVQVYRLLPFALEDTVWDLLDGVRTLNANDRWLRVS